MPTINEYLADNLTTNHWHRRNQVLNREPQDYLTFFPILSKISWSREQITGFFDCLKEDTTLTTLDLNIPLDDELFAYFAEAIAENHTLKNLYLSGIYRSRIIEQQKIDALTQALKRNYSLTSIDIDLGTDYPFDPYIARNRLMIEAPLLFERFLSNTTDEGDTDSLMLEYYLKQAGGVPSEPETTVYLSELRDLLRVLTISEHIRSPNQQDIQLLRDCLQHPYQNARLQAIADGFMDHHHIAKPPRAVIDNTELQALFPHVEDERQEKVAFEESTKMTPLPFTPITSESDVTTYLSFLDYEHLDRYEESLAQALAQVEVFNTQEKSMPPLQGQSIFKHRPTYWNEAYRLLKTLHTLSQGAVELGDVADSLSTGYHCESLETIRVKNFVIQSLLFASQQSISELSFEDEGLLFDDSAKLIADMLTSNHHILRVNLSDNLITAEGIEAIAHMLKLNTTIQSLDISNNPGVIFKTACTSIVDALNVNHSLVTLKGFEDTSVQLQIDNLLARNRALIEGPKIG